jgi:hypothetical protein
MRLVDVVSLIGFVIGCLNTMATGLEVVFMNVWPRDITQQ